MRFPRTFVFVDLSGFTHYIETHGDRKGTKLLAAFRAVARAVASERGVRIDKYLGDGFMAVAVEQDDGVVFAMELRRRAATAWRPPTGSRPRWDNPQREAGQTAAGAIGETRRWRKVRTAQGSAGANGSPPRGEDQSNRDESRRGNPSRVKRAISARSNTK